MKRKLPSNIFFIMENTDRPYLSELVREIEAMGIGVRLLDHEAAKTLLPGTDDYIITDCILGSERARKSGTGYMAHTFREGLKDEYWDAQCIIEGFDEVDADFVIKMYERSKHIPWTILETPRTIIRELTLEDIDDMYSLYAEPGLSDYIPPLCEDRDDEVEFEKMYISSMYEFYGYGIWTILDRETERFIGRAGVAHRDGYEDLEVGYMLSSAYQHKGIATEVVTAIISYAKKKFGCESFNAFIDENNTASIRFAQKLGFKKKGDALIEGRNLSWYILESSKKS